MVDEYQFGTALFRNGATGRVLTFAVQGDTQYIVDDEANRDVRMYGQRDFINGHCDAAFHVGDVVGDGTDTTQFRLAREYWACGIRVPWLCCPGNWDFGNTKSANCTDPQIPNYTRYLQDNGFAKLVFTANPVNGATVTIGDVVYELVDALTDPNDVLIGADLHETMTHLYYAVNAPEWSSFAGTKYHASTAVNAKAYGDRTWRTDVTEMLVYGRADQTSAVAVSESGANIAWEGGVTELSAPLSTSVGYGGVAGRDWYVECDKSMRRWAIAFERRGVKWLGISVPFGSTTADMAWADEISKRAAYADHWVVLLTHSIIHREEAGNRQPTQFLQVGDVHAPDNGTYWGQTNGYPGAATPSAYRTEVQVGQEMWDTYLSTWDNLKFAFGGHHFATSTFPQGYRLEAGNNGQQVHIFHANYQGPSQDLDHLRLLRMVEAYGQIVVQTYSPLTGERRRGTYEDWKIADSEIWTPPNA